GGPWSCTRLGYRHLLTSLASLQSRPAPRADPRFGVVPAHQELPSEVKMNHVPIPESHRDLLDGNACVALTTVMPGGQPQITPVWCNRDEEGYVLLNIMRGFRKEKNMRTNPKVTVLAYDTKNPLRSIEIRGTVIEMTEEGALEHLNQLTQLYMHKSDARFFGDSVPAELKATHVPVKIKIAPMCVRVEG
ncbi:MAG TPA: pyridoxamine 5'-phosphate oxidase family protein, partial [Ktedonobacteraceae bacterium]